MRFAWAMLILMVAGSAGATTWVSFPWPDLSVQQVEQLATAVDGERPDEPALYPLLLHMRAWSGEDVQQFIDFHREHMEAGAGWHRVLGDPAGFRGETFLLEGRFAGRVRDVELLRGGPWGKTVTEWGLVRDGPKDAGGRVAVVYFPCARDVLTRPRDRQRVRVAARFFKLWTDVDEAGVETTYPLFVAAPFWEPVGVAKTGAGWRVMVVLVLGLTVGLWAVRRVLGRGKRTVTRTALKDRGTPSQQEDAVAVDLPDDPAEALGVLRERGADGRYSGNG